MSVDGILNIDKPLGLTSFQVVARIRRLTGQRKVGHGGALDPLATGVLPVCLGQGTRVTEFFMLAAKTYEARIELGITTDSYDAAGKIVSRADPSKITLEQLKNALDGFRGWVEQVPPMYSALRHQGKHLYELARSGQEVERQPRKVHIYRIDLLSASLPEFTIEIDCSKGTYIRSLAQDLGVKLGCGAYLKNLVRLRCGPFELGSAVSLANLEQYVNKGEWQKLLYPIDTALGQLDRVTLDAERLRLIEQGRPVPVEISNESGICRAYSEEGRFVALLKYEAEKNLWHPEKVFVKAGDN